MVVEDPLPSSLTGWIAEKLRRSRVAKSKSVSFHRARQDQTTVVMLSCVCPLETRVIRVASSICGSGLSLHVGCCCQKGKAHIIWAATSSLTSFPHIQSRWGSAYCSYYSSCLRSSAMVSPNSTTPSISSLEPEVTALGSAEHTSHAGPAHSTVVAENAATTTADQSILPAYEHMSAPQLRNAYTTHLTTVHTIGQRFADACTAVQTNLHLSEEVRQEWLGIYDRWLDLALAPHIENEEGIRHRALELRVVLPRLTSVWDDDWPCDGEGRPLSPDVEIFGHQPEVQQAHQGQMHTDDDDAGNMGFDGNESSTDVVVVGEHGTVHSGASDSEHGPQQ